MDPRERRRAAGPAQALSEAGAPSARAPGDATPEPRARRTPRGAGWLAAALVGLALLWTGIARLSRDASAAGAEPGPSAGAARGAPEEGASATPGRLSIVRGPAEADGTAARSERPSVGSASASAVGDDGDDGDDPGDAARDEPAAPARLATAAPAAAPRATDELPAARRDAALERRLVAIVDEALAEAAKRSDGRASAASCTVGLHVRRFGRAGELAGHRADRSLKPASNMKLVTTAAALALLGADFELTTRFEGTAAPSGGVLRGDLVVRAGGDPLFDPAHDGVVEHLLAPALADLRAAGVERVTGDLVLDEGAFLAPEIGPSWPDSRQHWQDYCARSGGFSANAGCLTAVVEPGTVGREARVRVLPEGHGLERAGTVTTVAARKALTVAVEARPPRVTVRGELPADVPRWSTRFAHPDPVELFGNVLRGELARAGIRVEGAVVRRRDAPAATPLAEVRTPLSTLLRPVNTDSNNAVADQLFLVLGRELTGRGDRAGGREAVSRALARLGVSDEGLVQVDGSGLSREDRVCARQVTALLQAALSLPAHEAQPFLDSLALAGETGTLEDRMRDSPARGRVRAKTGWISGVSALSGVVESAEGELLLFSILVEYPRVSGLNTRVWKPMQARVCEELVAWHE